jgi:hypothetical protein
MSGFDVGLWRVSPASARLSLVVQGGASVWLGLGLVAVVSACGGLSGSSNDTGGSAARAGATTGGSSTTGGTGGSSTSGGSGGAVSAGGAGGSAATSGASTGGAGGTGGSIDTGGAGGTGAGSGTGGTGAGSGTGGTIGFGGSSGTGGVIVIGGTGGAAGAAGAGAVDSVSYGAVVTNVTDCCDFVTVLRADYATNTCVFFDIAIEVGGTVMPPRFASVFPGADHCCPNDPMFAAICAADSGCPRTTSVTGTITADSGTLDVDLALVFDPVQGLPPTVDFQVQDLPPNACPAPKGLPPCLQPRDSGPCDAAIMRFAFDPETLTCVPFVYGGCAGNANRFETLEACEAACVAPLAPECADARRGDGCPCTQHEQCDGTCSSVPYEQGEGCAPSSVGYCTDVSEGNCACRFDTGERACGV